MHNEQHTPPHLSSVGQRYFHLIEFDSNEQLLAELRKHPIGLFFIYAAGFGIAAVIFIMLILLGTSSAVADIAQDAGVDSGAFKAVALGFGVLFTLFIIGATLIYGILYQNNVIFVTSDKIAQVLYQTLFHRKISQLSIGDVQDVTVTQKGVLAHIFNYGTLVVETAGEQQNYTFSFIPDPYRSAKEIVGAHERNLVLHGN